MRKAIGYIRVSTEQQAEQGVSIETQQAKIEAWCELNEYELTGIYDDAGISGLCMKNSPQLQAALSAVKKDKAPLVYSFSRLASSSDDLIATAKQLGKRGADLVSISERIDTTGAAGKMLFRILAVLPEFERDLVSERTTAALAHKKATMQKYAPVPFGYKEVEGRLEVVHEEAQVVSEILNMRGSGHTLAAIAETMNSRGIPGKRGGTWYPSTVKYLIERQAA